MFPSRQQTERARSSPFQQLNLFRLKMPPGKTNRLGIAIIIDELVYPMGKRQHSYL